MADFLFLFFAALTVACAVGVVVNRNAVNAALCLMLSLVGVAGLFVLLNAYLLAALLILVYAGAVVALFLFIVMLLDMQGGVKIPFKAGTLVASMAAAVLLAAGVLSLRSASGGAPGPAPESAAPTGTVLRQYAELLFTTYLLPVQVIGFLLLIAMLGVIVLSRKLPEPEDLP